MSEPGFIDDRAGPRTVYAQPAKAVVDKVLPKLDRHSRRFLELSPFFCIGSTRPDGRGDVSPQGGEAGFVHAISDTELAFSNRPGADRLDTLGNIVREPGVGLVFFIPGVEEVLRLNGLARVTTREDLMARFTHEGKRPRSVVLVEIDEVYFMNQDAKKNLD
ncbi:pyridoxamine 5'-phosphate oxidase family protein [Caulobacter segnis]